MKSYVADGVALFTLALQWALRAQLVSSSSDCQRTATHEVLALRNIGKELGEKNWNFKEDPCTNHFFYTSWYSKRNPAKPTYVNQVTCECFGGCFHLVNISLKGQNLAGVLPKSLAKLPYLKIIDLSRNLLSGTIPREWVTMKLNYMSLMANRLSGPIPAYLGNITTLDYLSLESNSFYGTIPVELGNLVNLQNLILSDNQLTGTLPKELKNLRNLTELRISGTKFSRAIPDYFRNWQLLQKLEIQGSGFEGPIPSGISLLTGLIELRISDLIGHDSRFPSLDLLMSVERLILRNCKLYGSIPIYLSEMTKLKMLDLSFNKLNGSIPRELGTLPQLQSMFLTSNMLSGPIPSWVMNRYDSHMDLSYNNFDKRSAPSSCNKETLNLYRSFSREENLKSSMCLKDFDCKTRYSLYINCGGKETTIGKDMYAEDDEGGGAAKFIPRSAEWGFSSSGEFLFAKSSANYISRNKSVLRMRNSELFMEGRLSATSLTYFGNCLGKGNYSVTLHFSEIAFDNNSYSSLGRRVFDIYIQEKLVHKDFNIEEEAQGLNKVATKVFKHIPVSNSIEIRFYYAGKGSTGIPLRGTYGPLISAISVESDFKPPPNREKMLRILVGVASSLFLVLIVFILWWKYCLRNKTSREQDLEGLDLLTGKFTFRQIKAATNNFNDGSKLGEGGFGAVYLGTLLDGTYIAVKQLSSKSSQGNREFVNEIGMISGLHHPNVVKLYGCCVEGRQLLLIYEYMENNNLARAMLDNDTVILNWSVRQRICIHIARGLTFLHDESTIKIVHRDIKATNILLDRDLNAKISDFGLARLDEEENTHISIPRNGGSCTNGASQEMVDKLGLELRDHPRPYTLKGINKDKGIKVTKQALVNFKIGLYLDSLWFDVLPMDACHLLLGRPWQYDRDVTHEGKNNHYIVHHGGRKFRLIHLPLSEVRRMRSLTSQKAQKEDTTIPLDVEKEVGIEVEKEDKVATLICNPLGFKEVEKEVEKEDEKGDRVSTLVYEPIVGFQEDEKERKDPEVKGLVKTNDKDMREPELLESTLLESIQNLEVETILEVCKRGTHGIPMLKNGYLFEEDKLLIHEKHPRRLVGHGAYDMNAYCLGSQLQWLPTVYIAKDLWGELLTHEVLNVEFKTISKAFKEWNDQMPNLIEKRKAHNKEAAIKKRKQPRLKGSDLEWLHLKRKKFPRKEEDHLLPCLENQNLRENSFKERDDDG